MIVEIFEDFINHRISLGIVLPLFVYSISLFEFHGQSRCKYIILYSKCSDKICNTIIIHYAGSHTKIKILNLPVANG